MRKRSLRVLILTVVLLLMAGTLGWIGLSRSKVHAQADCDDNAAVRCGITAATLKQKCLDNQGGNLQSLYQAFGIANCDTALDGLVSGVVNAADNTVSVNGQVVGVDAFTAGRQDISNANGSSTPILNGQFFKRQPHVSFANPAGQLDALVKLNASGQFQYAIISSCGNPVIASLPPSPPSPPSPPPAQPASTPPQPAQPAPATPAFTIVKDVRVKGQTDWAQDVSAKPSDHLEYRITVKNTGQTTLKDISVHDNLPDGTSIVANSLMVNGQPNKGDIHAGITIGDLGMNLQTEIIFEVAVSSDVQACGSARLNNVAFAHPKDVNEQNDNATAQVCKNPPPVQQAAAPAPTPTSLPSTGFEDIFGIFAATSAGGTLAYRIVWLRRRR